MLLHALAPPGIPKPEDFVKLFVEKKSMNYVIVQNNTIVNIIDWDSETPYTPPNECEVYRCDSQANIGWLWIDGKPVDPNLPAEVKEYARTEVNTEPVIL